jgi:hypothetical protein
MSTSRSPPVTEVMEDEMRTWPTVDNGIKQGPVPLNNGSFLDGATTANPRVGSDIWAGEDQAAEFVKWTVEAADKDGRLRGILDAVRSHRIKDDFTNRWTYEEGNNHDGQFIRGGTPRVLQGP